MTTKSSILRTIREHCIECMGGMQSEVERCTSPKCNLFSYRMGKDPNPNTARGEITRRVFHTETTVERENETN